MFCRYGSFDFHPWECSLGVFAEWKRSDRGYKTFQNVVFTFKGDIVGEDQYDINARYSAMTNAFSSDGRSCGLVHDNGTPTRHWMPNHNERPDNLTDVQVIHQRLPDTVDGEFVSGRKFEFVVASMYLQPDSQILEFRETLTRQGTAGPVWRWERDRFWGVYPILVAPASSQILIQQGHTVGVTGYLSPQPPLYGAPFEIEEQREIKHIGPKRMRKGNYQYTTAWRYVYKLPLPDVLSFPSQTMIFQ